MTSYSKQTKNTNMHKKSMLRSIKYMLPLVMMMALIVIAVARSIDTLPNPAANITFSGNPTSARSHAIGKREVEKKKVLSFTDFSNDGIKDHLSNHNLAIVEDLVISQKTLSSVKFLERLKFPALKKIKLIETESESAKTNITQNTSPKPEDVNLHIKWNKRLETLEIDTDNVFEGISSLVEKTTVYLIIPLPLFMKMHRLGPVNLIVESIKFTYVNIDELSSINQTIRKDEQRNTSVKEVFFMIEDRKRVLEEKNLDEVYINIIKWVRVIFQNVSRIDAEEKGFEKLIWTRRTYVRKRILQDLPALRLFRFNNVVGLV